ncbi:Reductase C-terminal [Brevibacterium sandarakinum]|uniref:Reductase C-terminal n=1 Tax=Brevibacterium sandarakinum TaxID=629680 RepID=A0A1H1SJX4_BRESA|nr:FAD-dependent oxidoreductase [Brevibacterium sandarakinum]SDS48252.1 Reductase C-terminal [Brevibacterium sandarakinum]
MRVVIVGGGLSALRSAENLRKRGFEGEIVVVADEEHLPYNRPPLSKEFLWGDATQDELSFGVPAEDPGIEWKVGHSVIFSNLEEKTLTLRNGETLTYDGLVAATGVSSRRLSIPGPQEGRIVLRSLNDAISLKEKLKPGARLVCLGAGFIGCEVARTAQRVGCDVDIVAIDPVPMVVPLGKDVGAEVQRRHEAAGVRFHMGQSIAEMLGHDRIEAVKLDDGTELPADFVLETVGSVPNTEWLAGNALDLKNGVLTDAYLRCGGRSGVVAVGDVARFANPMFAADPLRIEHWQTAIDTTVFATATLMSDLGLTDEEPKPVSIMPWFWSDQGNVRMTSYGMLGLADSTEVVEGEITGECAVSYLRDGEQVGILLIGTEIKQRGARFKRQLAKTRRGLTAV